MIAASVRTLVVSWNEAADKNELVASEAFVGPDHDPNDAQKGEKSRKAQAKRKP